MSEPIDAQCRDPIVTRRRAVEGKPVPCHRCLAYEPHTPSGCRFIERGQTPKKRPPPTEAESEPIW